MRTRSKAFLTSACVFLLVAASAFGTLAYLTDRESAENIFTVGNVNITLDEANVDKDKNGEVIPERDKENDYHLLPGYKYMKDPTVTVEKGSEDCYVRLMVTISNSASLDELFEEGFTAADFLNLSTDWKYVKNVEDSEADTRTYEFRYKEAVAKNEQSDTKLPPIFTTVSVPEEISGEQLAKLEGLIMDFTAHAIQKAGFADADEAWSAFDEQTEMP